MIVISKKMITLHNGHSYGCSHDFIEYLGNCLLCGWNNATL